MNILFLAHRIPFPPDKGDKIRSLQFIRHLSRHHRIFLGTLLAEASDENHVPELEKYCRTVYAAPSPGRARLLLGLFSRKPFSVIHFYNPGLQAFVDTTLAENQIQAVFCFCSSMAEYVFNTPLYEKSRLAGIRLIMDFVDLDSYKWRQYAQCTTGIKRMIYKTEWRRLLQYEKKINDRFEHSIFISEKEKSIFEQYNPDLKNITIVPNGVDQSFFLPALDQAEPELKQYIQGPLLVFTGRMDYFANVNGVLWFCSLVFPKIRRTFPNAQFYIVGNQPTDEIWALTEIPGITVTGYVEDIKEYYRMADVCVIPLKIARGLQNKGLEAMATGNAVVATSSAKEGIACADDTDLVIADDADGFAGAVIDLLQNKEKREHMGQQAMETVRRCYHWPDHLKILDHLLENSDAR